MENQFSNLYKKLEPSKLLEIIEHSKDYEPAAVEAAKAELENRQLNALDIDAIKHELKLKEAEQHNRATEANERKKERTAKAFSFLNFADPLVENTPGRSIVVLCIILSVIALFKIVSSISMISYVLKYAEASSLLNLDTLELIYLPVTIIFLFRRSLTGFRMLILWFCYRIVFTGVITYYSFQLHDVTGPLAGLTVMPDLPTCFMLFTFYGGLLYFINRPAFRSLFYMVSEQDVKQII